MARSFTDLQTQIMQITRTKGTDAGKKAGKDYCEAWKRDIEAIRMSLSMQKGRMSPDDYNKQVLELNKQISEMNMSVNAFNKMISTVK